MKPEDEQGRSLLRWALERTEQVRARMQPELKRTGVVSAFELVSGMVFYAAQKLIDRQAKAAPREAIDEAVITACSRLFSDCLGAYLLASQGLVLPAIALVRSAFEVVTQTAMLMEHPDLAVPWLEGRRFAPKDVRKRSKFAAAQKAAYDRLSGITHPNVDAVPYHVVPLSVGQGQVLGTALAYGGWYCPKTAGHVICEALSAQLSMLEVFYLHYAEKLKGSGLLWRSETVEAWKKLGADPEEPGFAWPELLGVFRRLIEDAQAKFDAMPDDAVGVARHITTHMKGSA